MNIVNRSDTLLLLSSSINHHFIQRLLFTVATLLRFKWRKLYILCGDSSEGYSVESLRLCNLNWNDCLMDQLTWASFLSIPQIYSMHLDHFSWIYIIFNALIWQTLKLDTHVSKTRYSKYEFISSTQEYCPSLSCVTNVFNSWEQRFVSC